MVMLKGILSIFKGKEKEKKESAKYLDEETVNFLVVKGYDVKYIDELMGKLPEDLRGNVISFIKSGNYKLKDLRSGVGKKVMKGIANNKYSEETLDTVIEVYLYMKKKTVPSKSDVDAEKKKLIMKMPKSLLKKVANSYGYKI